jgi:hypothetical protein
MTDPMFCTTLDAWSDFRVGFLLDVMVVWKKPDE